MEKMIRNRRGMGKTFDNAMKELKELKEELKKASAEAATSAKAE